MATAATRDVDGSIALPVGGMDERGIPEAIQPDDFHYVRGWIQGQIGNLVKTPGKSFLSDALDNLRGQAILAINPFGDYVLIQTETNLYRFSNAEIFGGVEYTNVLTPDTYPITAAEEEAMAQILIKYHAASGVAGAAIAASPTWVKVPLTIEMRDTGGNCVVNAGGSFTLSAGAYPKNIRFKAKVKFASPDDEGPGASGACMAQLRLKTTAGVFIESGMNTKINTSNQKAQRRQEATVELDCAFILAAATEYQLEIICSKATIFGEAAATGNEEKYALVEMLME